MGLMDELKKIIHPYDDEDYDYEDDFEEPVKESSRSLFDDRKDDRREDRRSEDRHNKVVNIHATTQLKVVLVKPERFENASEIADHLKEKRTVVLNLESTNKDVARRLIDFLSGVAYAGAGRKRRFTAYVADATGQAELVWFQGVKWIEKRIEVGREYLVFGRPSFYRGELSVAHPELETMEQALSRKAESGMQGIYPSTEKLGNVLGAKGMYQIICNAWTLVKDRIADPLPEAVRTRYGLIGLRDAIYNIHFRNRRRPCGKRSTG